MRKFIKKFKNSIIGKILKVLLKLLWWALEAVIIFIALVIVTQRVTNDEEGFLGFRIYNVATGSMEPEYAVGDILISREKEPEEIKVGDNIVYLGDEGGYDGKIITHTVIQKEQDEKGNYLFHTKGKANTVEDPIVDEDQIYGVIVQNNIVLAWLCKILTNRYGLYFFVVIPVILYAFIEFVKAQGEKIEQEKEEKRLEEEKRRKRKKKKVQEQVREKMQQEEQDEQDEENLEAEVKTTKKVKRTTKRNAENETLEEEDIVEIPRKPRKTAKTTRTTRTTSTTKQPTQKSKNTEKTTGAAKQIKTTSVTKQTKTTKMEKSESEVEKTAPKTTRRKKAQEE